MKKILILGGSSFVGRFLFARLGINRAIATYNSKTIDNGVYFDSLSMSLSDIINEPESISHAVILLGDTDPESCAADIKRSNALNVDSIKSIIRDLNFWGIRTVFTSSEFVFDGTKGNYIEGDPVTPILTYGNQKIEIERYLQNSCDDFIIVRLAKIFGSQPGDGTIFADWLNAIEKNQTIYCAYDQVFSPIYVEDVVEGIIRLIESDCRGIFHLSGTEPFKRIDILEILLEKIKSYTSVNVKVIPCSIHDFNLREKRPLNVSMRPDKLIKTTGLRIGDVEQYCRKIVERKYSS